MPSPVGTQPTRPRISFGVARRSVLWWTAGLLLLLAAVAGYGYRTLFRPRNYPQPLIVEIRAHTSINSLAQSLQKRGIIPSALTFRIYARLTHQGRKLKIGEYEISGVKRPVDILALLASGNVKAYWLTVPEGKWASEIEQIIAAQWPHAAEGFAEMVADPASWRGKVSVPLTGNNLEGYLFPDTYRFAKGVTARQIVLAMLKRFDETCYADYRAHPPADGRSLQDVLTLASLVEAEAKAPEERPQIAGVYMNRLRRHMLLQCDATILYAHQQRLSRVWDKDLLIDSPYNTYQRPGLPIGPINNPGRASFQAALHPADVPYLYYVARGDGTHVFSRTLAEHAAAIHQIRGK